MHEIDFAAVGKQVAILRRPRGIEKEWRVLRYMRKRERLRLEATPNLVRPQEMGKRR